MSLIDVCLPEYQFVERHHIAIAAPPGRVLDVADAYDPDQDALIHGLIRLRQYPARLLGRAKDFGLGHFLRLGREADRELVLGLAGKFWEADFGLAQLADPAAFAAYREAGAARLTLNFRVTPTAAGCRLDTETRVHCHDERARRRFAPYWLLIRPFSGLIRRRMLAGVKRSVEQAGAQA
jgi:hypothetical protein